MEEHAGAQGYVQHPSEGHDLDTSHPVQNMGQFIMCHHPAQPIKDSQQQQGDALAVALHT